MKFQLIVSILAMAAVGLAGNSMAQDGSGKGSPVMKDWPPKPYALARYESAWSRNPFHLKTAPPTAAAASPVESFARNLFIAGVSQVGEDKAVILINRETSQYLRVTKTPNPDGLRLISVQHDPDIRKVVARIARGTEEAEIRYGGTPAGSARPSTRKTAGGRDDGPVDRPDGETPKPENGRE